MHIMIISFGQRVQTQIRLQIEELFDQDLPYLQFSQYLLEAFTLYGKAIKFEYLRAIATIFSASDFWGIFISFTNLLFFRHMR